MFAIVPNELLTDGNAADFLPKERHLRRKTAIDTVKIDDSITVVCEGGESHPIVGLVRATLGVEGANMAIDIRGERLYVVASSRRKTKFANCFAVRSEEDVLYYMLAVCEHVGFEVSEVEVMASSSSSEVPVLVKKYFEVKG